MNVLLTQGNKKRKCVCVCVSSVINKATPFECTQIPIDPDTSIVSLAGWIVPIGFHERILVNSPIIQSSHKIYVTPIIVITYKALKLYQIPTPNCT